MAQRGMDRDQQKEEKVKKEYVKPEDRFGSWRLLDDFTLVDSIPIDTITAGFQNYNPIFKKSYSNIYLGNIGSAYMSNLMSDKGGFNEFIFLNNLREYFTQPQDLKFYDSKVPYTNLTYIYSQPKRLSEENISVFFTQNVNRKLNIGFNYHLLSSIGLYRAQLVDNRNFNFFMSYRGDKYSMHGAVLYNKAAHKENGGIENDSIEYITDPKKYEFDKAEDIRVKYANATNFVENYQFFIHQSLGIGKINMHGRDTLVSPVDSLGFMELEELELPVSTVYHTFHLSTYKRAYKISGLSDYFSSDGGQLLPLYENIYADSVATADTSRYASFKNTFQIKFNEEANSLLKFGLRAYLVNDIKHYKYQEEPTTFYDSDDTQRPYYRGGDTTLVTTHIGGQIFKNIGENFWWNLGGKLFVQGYRVGDLEVEGNVNTLYKVLKDTAGVYGKGKISLRSPELFQERYYSNHFKWDRSLKQQKSVDIEFGLNIPTRDLKLSFESQSITDYLYWNYDAEPDQSSELINAFQISLFKHFKFGPLHSNNQLAYQYTSNERLFPLPDFTGKSSNYFDFYLAKRVLNVQIGFDVRYHTAYYTPAYMPATGQFYLQDIQKVGNYPFMDAFMNLQLKRARIFLKFDHFNQSFMDNNYFLTRGYPHNPTRFIWGISWNFYD